MDGVTCCTGCIWCCSGEVSGEPLESDDRSEEAEWMECNCEAETVNQPFFPAEESLWCLWLNIHRPR